jgi:D-glycero-D-manno-heptose 1,7-bisphosphate phosphatase
MNKAFFLDRDGTINVDYDYVHRPDEWTWCKDAIKALQWMKDEGYKIIIVTNQSGIARGRYTDKHVEELHEWVDEQLKPYGIHIDGWYYSPYHPDYHEDKDPDLLKLRKPDIGMFMQAKDEHDIDFKRSFMAGDKITDLKPAVTLGMKSYFIRSRHEPNQDKNWLHKHQISVHDTLWDAVQTIQKEELA